MRLRYASFFWLSVTTGPEICRAKAGSTKDETRLARKLTLDRVLALAMVAGASDTAGNVVSSSTAS